MFEWYHLKFLSKELKKLIPTTYNFLSKNWAQSSNRRVLLMSNYYRLRKEKTPFFHYQLWSLFGNYECVPLHILIGVW